MKAGYRSDKWKWVLSLSQNGKSTEATTATSESDSTQEAVVEVDVGENGLQKEALHSEVNTCKSHQKNGATQNHSKAPHVFSEDQLTMEQILKTYGMDRWPKHLPCTYVND